MRQLVQFDKGNPKIPAHARPSISDDEFETPQQLFTDLCKKYKIYPELDVAATHENRKCKLYYSKEDNALEQEFAFDVWCNHPHTLHAQFVEKCRTQWEKHNISIMMIIPANCMRTTYWHRHIEGIAEYHAIPGAIRFLKNNKPTKESSRNAYVCVIWRKKN